MKERFILIHDGPYPLPELLALDPAELLSGMYDAIDCDCVEVVHVPTGLLLPHGVVMVVDESGWLRSASRVNKLGSLWCGDTIMGNVILAAQGCRDGEPDLVGLSDSQLDFLCNAFGILLEGYL